MPIFDINAQFDVLPCDDPDNNTIGCFCETAGILCTPDELDGFEFSMSAVPNTGGLSGDLCPELSDTGIPHNVNFFAFVVWCEELTFDVLVNSCIPGTITGSNIPNFGIQMALFANCPASDGGDWNTVECITNGSETCFVSESEVPTFQSFSATELEIGEIYYFMIDGCFTSTCNITIDVQGVCGNGEITEWDMGLIGPTYVCVGDTETYIAEDAIHGLDGAEEYYYYLNGVPFAEGEELFNLDITWNTSGSYNLCVDVSNLPCIPETEMPAQNCQTIIVSSQDNGIIEADQEILCPLETSNISVSLNNPDPLLLNYIIIVDQDSIVIQIVEGLSTMLTENKCGNFTAYYYSFYEPLDLSIPTMGELWTLPNCQTDCCSLKEVNIIFEDNDLPIFTTEPVDLTLDCSDDIIPNESLTWVDNCTGTGVVIPVVEENFTLCDGGNVLRIWSFTDSCANNVEHVQSITINPIEVPVFINPPTDIFVNCEDLQSFAPQNLEYTNSDFGTCEISGNISPLITDAFDICGGSISYTWEFTDLCGRVISHTQVVNIEPVAEAEFVTPPPASITITCEEWSTFTPPTLSFSNDQNGACEISGSIVAVFDDPVEPCGTDISYSWDFTDLCGRVISYTQVVTVESALSTNSITKENIQIYPNPTKNLINIKSEYNIIGMKLYTMTGNNLFQSLKTNNYNYQIDLSKYSSGLYLLQVETENGRWVEKVVRR